MRKISELIEESEKDKLLYELYKIYSPSGVETSMSNYIISWIKKYVPNAQIIKDNIGNLYVTKGESDKYPTLCCHMDQVQINHSDDFEILVKNNKIYGYSKLNQRYEGLGADDKNGIWVCLNMLKKHNILKIFFSVQEEIECKGARQADMSFFKNSMYIIEPDCSGKDVVKTTLKGLKCASDDFINDINAEKYGYKFAEGKRVDILILSKRGVGVSCINISTGYYDEHTDEEYTVKKDLIKCLNYVDYLISNLKKTYPINLKNQEEHMF